MAKKTIIIDGSIGAYSFSKQYIRHELEGNEKNAVLVTLSSLGGDVDHALNIYDQFIAHGNVTVELLAFVASSATLISLGAKHIRMNENSFYLIHKVWQWVDEWGGMNEDEIETLISKLEKTKKDLATVTLQLAKMYVKKTGKTLEQIVSLMKEERWLTAEEALDWGFVDEIFTPSSAQNYLEDARMVAMIKSSGYPSPKRKTDVSTAADEKKPGSGPSFNEETFFEKIWSRLVHRQQENAAKNTSDDSSKTTSKTIPKIISMKQFTNLNQTLGVEHLESTGNTVSLNKTQLGLIAAALGEDKFSGSEESVELDQSGLLVLDLAISSVAKAKAAQAEAEKQLKNTTTSIDAIDGTITTAKTMDEKIVAIRTLLASQPGVKAEGNRDNSDPEAGKPGDVDWEIINKLPHNQEVDQYA